MTEEFDQDALRELLLDSVAPPDPALTEAMFEVTFTEIPEIPEAAAPEPDLLPDFEDTHSALDLGADDPGAHDPGSDVDPDTDGEGAADDGFPGVDW
ncbi:hypothetical protein [Actinokineospora terrae]|uniref:Uncharacterized protein n=1 Tax=Actinokineospora terrae TaxID=155974 RepID=A0A1H9XSP4_9PSEU|nr:hypothetical protein [Actinokineospora terrae]SES49178.1 hypothetical protein SAMN04487818_1255 [Actinokineospora terrae]